MTVRRGVWLHLSPLWPSLLRVGDSDILWLSLGPREQCVSCGPTVWSGNQHMGSVVYFFKLRYN